MGDVINLNGKKKKTLFENEGFRRLKEAWDDNPVVVIGIVAAAFTAASRLIDSISAVQGRRAYARQVNYRTRK
jgi:hypothetical protein